MFSIKPITYHSRNEKLRAISVFASISHGKKAGLLVFFYEIFIFKFSTINGFSSSAIMGSEVSTLKHELRDDSMKSWAFVSKSLFPSAQGPKVLSRFGHDVIVQ